MRLSVPIKKMSHFRGELPRYESALASGFDLRAQLSESLEVKPGERVLIPTGLCFAVPEGHELQARPRSGLAIKKGITLVNTPGTIDADYRGEVKIILINHGRKTVTINDHDRIAQLVLCPIFQADFKLCTDLDKTDRGADGFGSTGDA